METASSFQCFSTSAQVVLRPNVVHEQPLNPDYITVWDAYTTVFIRTPFFSGEQI